MYIADLHIHSRFSRATSKDGDLPHLDWWARRKGIRMVGTGDFTHPAWRAELREQLVPAGEGVYTLRQDLRLPDVAPGEAPRFVITGEISCIYKRHGRTRKVHNLILLPSLEAADELSARLEAIGNIHSDGRPILGLDSRDLLELTLDTCPDAEFIPAHIWTPHFALFGAFSGFDTMEECFGDLTGHIIFQGLHRLGSLLLAVKTKHRHLLAGSAGGADHGGIVHILPLQAVVGQLIQSEGGVGVYLLQGLGEGAGIHHTLDLANAVEGGAARGVLLALPAAAGSQGQ